MTVVERHLTVSAGDMDDIHEALAWVVRRHDAEFGDATMLKIEIEQVMESEDGGDNWRYRWNASITGSVEDATLTGKDH